MDLAALVSLEHCSHEPNVLKKTFQNVISSHYFQSRLIPAQQIAESYNKKNEK
jgi:hypothetical protein